MTRVTGRRAAESAGFGVPELVPEEDWPDENATSSNHKTATFEARMIPPSIRRSRSSITDRTQIASTLAAVVASAFARLARALMGFRHRAEASGASDANSVF